VGLLRKGGGEGGVENRCGLDFTGMREGKKNRVIYIYCQLAAVIYMIFFYISLP